MAPLPRTQTPAIDFAQFAQKLGEGLEIPQKLIERIEALLPKILKHDIDNEITWQAHKRHKFTINGFPRLVIKIFSPRYAIRKENRIIKGNALVELALSYLVQAKVFGIFHQLSHIIIPPTRTFWVGKYLFLAQGKLQLQSRYNPKNPVLQNTWIRAQNQLTFLSKWTGLIYAGEKVPPLLAQMPECSELSAFSKMRSLVLLELKHQDDVVCSTAEI